MNRLRNDQYSVQLSGIMQPGGDKCSDSKKHRRTIRETVRMIAGIIWKGIFQYYSGYPILYFFILC